MRIVVSDFISLDGVVQAPGPTLLPAGDAIGAVRDLRARDGES